MFNSKSLIVICVFFGLNVSGSIITPCKPSEKACILSSAKNALPTLLRGIPELGVPSSDPLHLALVNGDLDILKFRFTDVTVTGYSNCDVTELDFNLAKSSLHLVMMCPETTNIGNYTMAGRLIVIPVEGEGQFTIIGRTFRYTVEAEIKKVTGKDGKNHLSIKNFKGKAEPLAPLTFKLTNLFNGNKPLSDAVHKFANENYKEVADFAIEPMFYAILKGIFKNVNTFFKAVPLEELVLN